MQALLTRTITRNINTSAVRRANATYPIKGFREWYLGRTEHAEKSMKMWNAVCIFVCTPALIAMGIFVYFREKEHMTHPRPPYIPYAHLYDHRERKLPWRDGKKSFFHNPVMNPIPGVGYEVPDPNEGAHHGHH